MHDRILEGYLKDFIADFGLSKVEHTKAFEHFVNYCIISKSLPEQFDFEDLSTGGGNDTAIDGIAILVNGHLVLSKDEVDYFNKVIGRLDAEFIFIQTKTSDKFELGDMGNFLFGVKDFFQDRPLLNTNETIKEFRELKEYIYDHSIDFQQNPTCLMYYVTTGSWRNDANLTARIQAEVQTLKQTSLFGKVEFTVIDADKLKSIYRELRLKVVREIDFERHTILPKIETITEAYIGILPCTEYIKLICDEDNNLQRGLFYDNVRDYQGENPVNIEIRDTVTNSDQRDRFVLLNNGITIVAKSVNKVGTTFKIIDYQIVNGCQTSHVLYYNRASLTTNMYVPIKLIVTDNAEVMNLVTKATNSQTIVQREAFESLSPFHKRLEEYYIAMNKDRDIKVYYERRSKQYESLAINKSHIVTLAKQINCFISMFLDTPQSTHRYYGELLTSNRGKIFLENHSLVPYFTSGLGICRLEEFIRKQEIDSKYKRFKYHLLMLLRIKHAGSSLPRLENMKRTEEYCGKLIDILYDEAKALQVFHELTCIIDIVTAQTIDSQELYEAPRRRDFTQELLTALSTTGTLVSETPAALSPVPIPKEIGIAFSWNGSRGQIQRDNGERVIFYTKDIIGSNKRVRVGKKVEFIFSQSDQGNIALEVELLE